MKILSKSDDKNIFQTHKRSDIQYKEKKYQELYNFLSKYDDKSNSILLTIILPMFNEENTVRPILDNLPEHDLIEIIVIDDCSTDNSVNEVKKVRSYKKIRLIQHKVNSGYGGTIITGIKNSNGKVIVTMDSDGQHSSMDIFQLIKPIFEQEAECTIGSRYLGRYHYKLPIITRLGELIIEKLIHIFFGTKITNNQNGFRAFNKEKIRPLFEKIKYKDFAFATEVTLLILLSGFRLKECPIILYDREYGSSKIVLSRLTIDIFSCIFRYILLKITKIFQKKPNL